MNPHHNAFPINTTGKDVTAAEEGLTKRELIAAMALQGVLSCTANEGWTATDHARYAVDAADVLIAELSK